MKVSGSTWRNGTLPDDKVKENSDGNKLRNKIYRKKYKPKEVNI